MGEVKRGKRIMRKVIRSTPNVSKLAQALTSVLGSESVHRGHNSDLGEPKLFIPSGVPELDYVLDRKGRGWPAGRVVEIYGGSATCKTGVAYALIAQAQKLGGDAILYPVEGNYDKWLAERYGVDVAALHVADDSTVEGVFSSYRKALRAVDKEDLLIGVVDSIADLSTKAELEEDSFDRDRAAQVRALMLSKAMRKLGAEIPRTCSLLFCINQVRDSTDAVPSKPKPPGGKALGFQASVRLRLELLQKVRRTHKGKPYVAGYKIKITAEKNRLARPFQEAVILLDFERGLLPVEASKKRKVRKL